MQHNVSLFVDSIAYRNYRFGSTSMQQHMQRGPGGPPPGELGYCNVHRRKRQRHDLVDDPEQPGQLRCTARRECRPFVPGGPPGGFQRTDLQDDANWCTCRTHGRRRNIHHMRDVGQGEYECMPPYLCHSGPNPNQGPRPPGQGGVGAGFYQPPRYDNENHPMARAAAAPTPQYQQSGYQQPPYGDASRPWDVPHVPTAPGQGQPASWQTSYFGPGDQNREGPQALPQMDAAVDVLCARHARRIAKDYAEQVDELFYVCRNSTQCLSGPLDPANTLPREEGILCSRHSTLRRPAFVALAQDGQHYECRPNHQCRATDVHMIQQPASLLAGVGGGNAPPAYDGEVGHEDGQGWGGGWRPTAAPQAPGAAPSAASFFA